MSKSPGWSHVVKNGTRKHNPGKSTAQAKPRLTPPREKKTYDIVGTDAVENIRAVMTKMVSVLDTVMLASYLKDKLSGDVTCLKTDTDQTWYSLFKITAE